MENAGPLDFLNRLLPNEGWRCGVALNGEKRLQKFFLTNTELADFLLRRDALGDDVYHACAVFHSKANRKAMNAMGAKAFWLDLDVGDDPKKYPTDLDAIKALGDFCQAINLPHPPTIVHSGGGLHAYFMLKEMMTATVWKSHALGLKQACFVHGLKADPVRTADISSILRTPGTHNHKYMI